MIQKIQGAHCTLKDILKVHLKGKKIGGDSLSWKGVIFFEFLFICQDFRKPLLFFVI